MNNFCYVNGEIMPADEGRIGITDLALQRGYGVFDFGRTYNGKLFHFEDNLKRFRRSASALHLELPLSDQEIREIALQLIRESALKIPAIRLILTGGYSDSSLSLEHPNFIIITEELLTYPDKVYTHGANLITVEYQRELPHVKSINYLNAIRLEPLKREKKAFDILYHSENGITECPRNNFFAFIGDSLVTPSEHILHGITRKLVLQLAEKRFRVEERTLGLSELEGVDEAFVTSTSKRVLPVTRIDDRDVGDGRVGERTKAVMQLFDEYTAGY